MSKLVNGVPVCMALHARLCLMGCARLRLWRVLRAWRVQKDYHGTLRFLGEALVEAPDSEHLNLLKTEVRAVIHVRTCHMSQTPPS
jgi:hypothetical protein